ncbi:MAG: SCO family protein [Bacteroidota bacterium]
MPQGGSNKKKYTYVWVSAVVLVFGIFTIVEITDRLENQSIVKIDRMSGTMINPDLAYVISDGERRRVPDFSFVNQDSVLVTNKDYLGKVYLVDFFFTTCPTICPVMTSNLVEIQNTFKDEKDLGILSFTINPRYDTPNVLKKYGEKYGVTHPNWNFLTGNQEEIYTLSREGFYILATEDESAPGGFEHSGMFALVDKEGYIRSRTDQFGNPIIYYRGMVTEKQGVDSEGQPQQITMLKEDIKNLLEE